MHIPGKTLKQMHNKLGTMELAKILGCTPRNVRHILSKSEFEYKFRRYRGKWAWVKYQEGQENG